VLPFDIESLDQGVRVNQATFARMCGVTRQTVNQWVKQGKITLFPDGTLDPKRAAQSVFDNTDPARMRAKVFQIDIDDSTEKIRDLHAQMIDLSNQLQLANRKINHLWKFCLESYGANEHILDFFVRSRGELLSINPDDWEGMIENIIDDLFLENAKSAGVTGDAFWKEHHDLFINKD